VAVEAEVVTTWRELDDAVWHSGFGRHPRHARSTIVFRGLARAEFRNISSLARLSGDYPALERHLIRNFRKYAHKAAPGPTQWDWLALGQHHGLPTRLLDWTFSPYVALHFATASWPDDDAMLWAVDCAAVHDRLPPALHGALEQEGSLVFTTGLIAAYAPELPDLERLSDGRPFMLFFEPPTLDERIANQAAVLSTSSDATCQMEDWLAEHPDTWRAWRLTAQLKNQVRARLDQAQISERILMPGLDGIAQWLRRYYSPRPSSADADGAHGGSMDGSDQRSQREGSMA
jgi:hypothetical protein